MEVASAAADAIVDSPREFRTDRLDDIIASDFAS
jgi:hypothetical protein